jgi:hypothetical protein
MEANQDRQSVGVVLASHAWTFPHCGCREHARVNGQGKEGEEMQVGEQVSFYRDGWRVGTIKQLDPERGLRKGMLQITHALTGDVWVQAYDVNVLGDTVYHGPKTLEVFEERQEQKRTEQAKADKLKVRRFHR